MPSNDTTPPTTTQPPAPVAASSKGRQRTPTQTPPVLREAPSPASLLRCLQRRLVLAVSLGVLLACPTAVGVWFFAPPPKHQVRTLIKVPPPSPYLTRTLEPVMDLASHQRNQMAMGKSRLVLVSALRDTSVTELSVIRDQLDAVGWLEREVQLDFSYAPTVLRISMNGLETDDLVPLVNAIRKAYLREVVDKERRHRVERKNHVAELMRKYEDQVKEARGLQKDLEEKTGGRDHILRARILSFTQQHLAMSEKDLLSTQTEMRKIASTLKGLKERQKSNDVKVAEADIAAALAKEPQIKSLRDEIQKLEQFITETLKYSVQGERTPSVVRARRDIKALKEKVSAANKRLRPPGAP